jgi:hypothetical protein
MEAAPPVEDINDYIKSKYNEEAFRDELNDDRNIYHRHLFQK